MPTPLQRRQIIQDRMTSIKETEGSARRFRRLLGRQARKGSISAAGQLMELDQQLDARGIKKTGPISVNNRASLAVSQVRNELALGQANQATLDSAAASSVTTPRAARFQTEEPTQAFDQLQQQEEMATNPRIMRLGEIPNGNDQVEAPVASSIAPGSVAPSRATLMSQIADEANRPRRELPSPDSEIFDVQSSGSQARASTYTEVPIGDQQYFDDGTPIPRETRRVATSDLVQPRETGITYGGVKQVRLADGSFAEVGSDQAAAQPKPERDLGIRDFRKQAAEQGMDIPPNTSLVKDETGIRVKLSGGGFAPVDSVLGRAQLAYDRLENARPAYERVKAIFDDPETKEAATFLERRSKLDSIAKDFASRGIYGMASQEVYDKTREMSAADTEYLLTNLSIAGYQNALASGVKNLGPRPVNYSTRDDAVPYTKFLLSEAQEAEAAGDMVRAEQLLGLSESHVTSSAKKKGVSRSAIIQAALAESN